MYCASVQAEDPPFENKMLEKGAGEEPGLSSPMNVNAEALNVKRSLVAGGMCHQLTPRFKLRMRGTCYGYARRFKGRQPPCAFLVPSYSQ